MQWCQALLLLLCSSLSFQSMTRLLKRMVRKLLSDRALSDEVKQSVQVMTSRPEKFWLVRQAFLFAQPLSMPTMLGSPTTILTLPS